MNNLWDAFKQYLSDAAPGGALNPEVTPQGLLDVAATASMPVPVVGDVIGGAADAYRYATNPEERTAGNFALSAMGLLPFVPGTFIGPSSKLWNSDAAFEAQKMTRRGESPEAIWEKTGTFKSPDGLFRQEIDDSKSVFMTPSMIKDQATAMQSELDQLKQSLKNANPKQKDLFPKQLTAARAPVRERVAKMQDELGAYYGPNQMPEAGNLAPYAYKNDVLYEAYPELKDVVIRQGGGGRDPSVHGSYTGKQLDVTATGLRNDPRSTTAHEFQHAIQDIEGFGRGGSPATAFQDPEAFKILDEVRAEVNTPMSFAEFNKSQKFGDDASAKKAYNKYVSDIKNGTFITPELDRQLQYAAANRYYKRLAGEAESRAVQKRLDMTPEQRRARFPLLDYDVPVEKIIPKHVGQFYDNLLWDF